MKYKCIFPGCDFCTETRSLIEYHHVHPRELHVKLNRDVTIPLCPTHHKLIYHPDVQSGQHSIKHPESLIVKQVARTNTGNCVIFEDMDGNQLESYTDTARIDSTDIFCASWNLVNGFSETTADDCEMAVADEVDRKGFTREGNTVFYNKEHRRQAMQSLSEFIANYMIQTKAEYDSALERARKDWQSVHSMART